MKAMKEETTEIKHIHDDKDLICSLCKRCDDNPEKYGEKITLQQHNLTVHYFCLLMSSGICQRGEEDEDVHGFLVDDIKKEIRRSSRLHYAHSAAMFFFKCTLCNNKDQFQQEMLRMGIYIPERDAAWELEENAYEDLLQVYQHCDAVKCHSHKGRKYSSQSGYFEIVRCKLCGSRGTHRKCSNLKLYESDWICGDCKAAVEGKKSVPLPNHVESPLAIRQQRKRLFKNISDLHSSLISKRQCVAATSPEVLMDLAHQISQQQSTEVLVEDDDGVLEAALWVLRQSDFNPCCTLSVKFSQDKHSNNIRSQRRFLRRLVSKLQMSEIFEGPDGSKNLALNSKALRDDLYFEVGSLLALSLVHGGPPVGFFSPALYHSLFNYPTNYRPTLQDLGDTAFAHKIRQIFGIKEKLIILTHRFREGLRTLGLFEQVQMCTEAFHSVFCGPVERLTAESVMELFTVRFSEEKEQQEKENTTVDFWKKYLHECEEGRCAASLEDLLTFITATDSAPSIGFHPTPSISFFSSPDPSCAFPQSHCDASHLFLPMLPSYELFKKHLDYTVCQFSVMQDI
ncbi:hypothetical protein cypCar_00012387 [Cyprinus carpio]|nr:hypothetical protein cypCar_00012387 [Cyprinus carpio]